MPEMLSKEALRIIKQEMAGLTGEQAKRQAKVLAMQLNCDISRIYHYSKAVRPARKSRSDKGKIKAMPEQTFEALSVLTVKYDLSAPHVSNIARGNNIAEVSAATFNRNLRKLGISRRQNQKDLKPYVSWEASAPNNLHQLDSTVAQQFYLDDDGAIKFESARDHNKNKPGNKKPRLTLLSLVDDYSRCIYARFMLNNNLLSWMNFLNFAWQRKPDEAGFPFCGLPKILYSDNDSVIKAGRFKAAMKKLGVEPISHMPGNPRAKGKVESSFRTLQEFEKITQVRKWKSLEEANADLFDFLYFLNNRTHSATKEVPFARWQRLPNDGLRNVPDDEIFRILHMESFTRLVQKNLTLKISGREWQLPWRQPFINQIGKQIEIYAPPQEVDKLFVVIENKEYEVHYAATDLRKAGGRHAELPKPEALIRREALQAAEDPKLKMSGFYKDLYRRSYMPKQGQEFDNSRITGINPAPLMRTKVWFIQACQEHLGFNAPPTNEERAWIDGAFGERTEVPDAELRSLMEKIKNGETVITYQQRAAGNAR